MLKAPVASGLLFTAALTSAAFNGYRAHEVHGIQSLAPEWHTVETTSPPVEGLQPGADVENAKNKYVVWTIGSLGVAGVAAVPTFRRRNHAHPPAAN